MMFYQSTDAQLRSLENRWRPVLNKYRGPIPLGHGVGHMLAESNGVTEPEIRDANRKPIGLMQITRRDGATFGYSEDDLKKPAVNIHIWAKKSFIDSKYLHDTYSAWLHANYDFWLAVRLTFIMGRVNVDNLISVAEASKQSDKITETVQAYMNTATRRFGRFSARDLRRISSHLDDMRHAMTLIDGDNKVSASFTAYATGSPENPVVALGNMNVL